MTALLINSRIATRPTDWGGVTTGAFVQIKTCIDLFARFEPLTKADQEYHLRRPALHDFEAIFEFQVWDDEDFGYELTGVRIDCDEPGLSGKLTKRSRRITAASDSAWFKIIEDAIERDRARITDRIVEEMRAA